MSRDNRILENEQLRLEVSAVGASLLSIFDKESGRELLWQGSIDTWSARDILIFPYIGRPKECYRVGGKPYLLDAMHGFARDKHFQTMEHSGESLVLELQADEETLRQYPFHFYLAATFTLRGRGYAVRYDVGNTAGEEMPYYIGAHPGFQLAGGDCVEFEQEEELFYFPKAGGGWSAKSKPWGRQQFLLPSVKLFDQYDSLVFDHVKSKTCTLARGDGIRLCIGLGDAPILTLWGRQNGGAFICVEPWWGFLESIPCERDFEKRRLINTVKGHEMQSHGYSCGITQT